MVDGSLGDQTQGPLAEPFPVNDVFIHDGRLQLLLCSEVKDLNCSALGLQRNDVLAPVHDRTVGIDWSPHHIIVVFQINNDNLGLLIFVELLANTDIVIGFKGLIEDGSIVSQSSFTRRCIPRVKERDLHMR